MLYPVIVGLFPYWDRLQILASGWSRLNWVPGKVLWEVKGPDVMLMSDNLSIKSRAVKKLDLSYQMPALNYKVACDIQDNLKQKKFKNYKQKPG